MKSIHNFINDMNKFLFIPSRGKAVTNLLLLHPEPVLILVHDSRRPLGVRRQRRQARAAIGRWSSGELVQLRRRRVALLLAVVHPKPPPLRQKVRAVANAAGARSGIYICMERC